MIVFILACIVSFIPSIALFYWFRGLKKEDQVYQNLCNEAMKKGLLSIFPIILVSGGSNLLIILLGFHKLHPLLYQMIYNFIVLALAEETVKYLTFQNIVKKNDYPYSWTDAVVLMSTVGTGFGLIESVIFCINSNIPSVLIKGLSIPHAGCGFIIGYFYGKGLKTGKKSEKWIGFIITWLFHGLYDFSLSKEFIAVNENLVLVAITLAVLEVVLLISLIVYVKRHTAKTEAA